MLEVGCPDPADVLERMESTRSCWASSPAVRRSISVLIDVGTATVPPCSPGAPLPRLGLGTRAGTINSMANARNGAASLRGLLDRWRSDLAAWAIPDNILSAVEQSPWVLPREVFIRRASRVAAAPSGPSYERAQAALKPPAACWTWDLVRAPPAC